MGLRNRKRPPVHVIGIDEVSRRKGQVYLTVVYDLERRVLLWVGEDRTEEAVKKFFTQELGSGAVPRCKWCRRFCSIAFISLNICRRQSMRYDGARCGA